MLRSILCNSIHLENCANSQLFKVFLPITQAQCIDAARVYYILNRLFGS